MSDPTEYEACPHPIELRQLAILGEHHYCSHCRCVLTTNGPEPVVVRRMVVARG